MTLQQLLHPAPARPLRSVPKIIVGKAAEARKAYHDMTCELIEAGDCECEVLGLI